MRPLPRVQRSHPPGAARSSTAPPSRDRRRHAMPMSPDSGALICATASFFPCTGAIWCARWQYANAPWPWSNPVCAPLLPPASPSTSRNINAARSRGLNRRNPSSRYSRCSARSRILFRAFGMALRSFVDFTKCGAAAAPQEVNRRVCGDSRQPVRGLLFVFELFLVLQRLDEGFLGQILGIRDVVDNPVNLHEDPP